MKMCDCVQGRLPCTCQPQPIAAQSAPFSNANQLLNEQPSAAQQQARPSFSNANQLLNEQPSAAQSAPYEREAESMAFEAWRTEQIECLRRNGYAEAAEKFYQLGSIHWSAWQARASWQRAQSAPELGPNGSADRYFYERGFEAGKRSAQSAPDEREAFEAFARDACRIPAHIPVNWEAQWTQQAWEGWQAGASWQRAQSAPVEPKPTGLSRGWNLVRQCDGFVIGHSSDEPKENHKQQALADGRVYVPFMVEQSAPVVPEGLNKTREQWQKVDAKQCANSNSSAANFYLIRDAQQDIERLHRALAAAPQPAAQSAVYVEYRQCGECQHGGINDAAAGLAACHDCDWTGPEPVEDKCPGCHRENCMAASCPKCGARYVLMASEDIAAIAQPAARQEQGDEVRRLREALEEIQHADMNAPVSESNAGCIKRIKQIAERALAESKEGAA